MFFIYRYELWVTPCFPTIVYPISGLFFCLILAGDFPPYICFYVSCMIVSTFLDKPFLLIIVLAWHVTQVSPPVIRFKIKTPTIRLHTMHEPSQQHQGITQVQGAWALQLAAYWRNIIVIFSMLVWGYKEIMTFFFLPIFSDFHAPVSLSVVVSLSVHAGRCIGLRIASCSTSSEHGISSCLGMQNASADFRYLPQLLHL